MGAPIMRCLACDSEDLQCLVTMQVWAKPAARGGTIKVGGLRLTQLDAKEAWDKNEVRGPFYCHACGAEHYYLPGEDSPLRLGSTDKIRAERAALAGK